MAIIAELLYKVNDQAIKKAEKSAKALENQGKKTALAMTGIGIGIAAIAAAGAGFVAMTKKTLDWADSLAKTADAAGITIERLQELRYAGERSGIAFTQMDAAVKAFGNRLGKDLTGMGGAATKSLEKLGIAQRIANGELKTTEEVMNATLRAIGELGTEAERTAHLTNVFGDEVGKKLTVMLKDGYQGVEALTERARNLGIVLDGETVRKAEAAKDALFDLGEVMRAQTMAAILDLMPQITSLVNTMIDNKDNIIDFASAILTVAKAAGTALNYIVDFGQGLGIFSTSLESELEKVNKALAGGWDDRLRFFGPEGIVEYYDEEELKKLKADLEAAIELKNKAQQLGKAGPLDNTAASYNGSLADTYNTNNYDAEAAQREAQRAVEEQIRLQQNKHNAIQSMEDEAIRRHMALEEDAIRRINQSIDWELELLRRKYDEELAAHEWTLEEKAKLDQAYNANVTQLERRRQAELQENAEKYMVTWEEAGAVVTRHLMDGIRQGKGFQDVIKGIIISLAEMIIQKQLAGIVGSIFGGGLLPSANGNVFNNGNLVPFANGGVISSPMTFPMADGRTGLMGEAGPEAIMPLKRGPGGKLGVIAQGGGGNVINLNTTINVESGATADEDAIARKTAEAQRAMIRQEIANQQRAGGMLNPVRRFA